MPQILWKGNEYTNSSDRGGNVPFAIVNHISAGSMTSMDNWFRSPSNDQSSAHFGVSKTGVIHQYVKIERMAWANGVSHFDDPRQAPLIKEMGINPNIYTISIEHEGTDGNLTEEQFQASVWLHKYIQAYVALVYGKKLLLDKRHVLGHYQVSPINKPNCPGPKFPWDRLYQAIGGSRVMNWTDEQWQMFAKTLNDLYHLSVAGELKHPVFSDYTWAEKAYRHELTVDEAVWLQGIMFARSQGVEV